MNCQNRSRQIWTGQKQRRRTLGRGLIPAKWTLQAMVVANCVFSRKLVGWHSNCDLCIIYYVVKIGKVIRCSFNVPNDEQHSLAH